MLNRRQFLGVVGAAASWPAVGLRDSPIGEWGSPVFDVHFHMRGQTAANVAHLDGAGITSANLLTRAAGSDQVRALQTAAPARFTWFCSADPSTPEGVEALPGSVKSGARGFGEMKYHLATDGPEFRRVYAFAADLRVPILIHFQEVDHFENEGGWSPGFARSFERILKAYPQTTFIGHADAFWANVSADYHNEAAYPSGRIVRGGITDKLASEARLRRSRDCLDRDRSHPAFWRRLPMTTSAATSFVRTIAADRRQRLSIPQSHRAAVAREHSGNVTAFNGPVNLNWMMTGPQADFWPSRVYTGQFDSENTPMRILAWRGQVVEGFGGTIGDRDALGAIVEQNDWNQYTVIARGGTFLHIVNGHLLAVMIDDDAASSNNWSGQFGIEIKATTKVSVRNIWVKKLS